MYNCSKIDVQSFLKLKVVTIIWNEYGKNLPRQKVILQEGKPHFKVDTCHTLTFSLWLNFHFERL